MTGHDLDARCVNTIRFLSADAVQKARSGHPGLPMGAAPMAYVLWTRFLRHNPADPGWPDRDRFVLSAGHGSMLLYALLHLTGYALPLDEIRRFRQWGSKTPGHPEYGMTPGVEATTGPLGQGLANAVGMAIAERHLAARFNRPGHTVVDHRTYVLCSDGDLMEGIAAEAVSLAGHLGLGRLIAFYDDNQVSLAGKASLSFSEDVPRRFEGYGWHTQVVRDGNDLEAVDKAIRDALAEAERPSLIAVRTVIGYGAPTKAGTHEAHGEPLGEEELRAAKQALGWPVEPPFHVPEPARARFREALAHGARWQGEWQSRFDAYARAHGDPAAAFRDELAGRLTPGWDAALPTFAPDAPTATRDASGAV
ncbi:MAG: transketolase, partial [Candidatus Rokuibacteriota bacterium]